MYTFKTQFFNFEEVKNKLNNYQFIKKSFFYDYEWLETCYEKSQNKKNFFYVENYYKEKILLIMFLEIKKFFFLKKLTWLFDKDLNFITPIIINNHNFNKEEFKLILKKIFNHFKVDFIQLDKNPKIIDNIINPLNLYKNIQYEKIAKIRLENISWDDYYNKIFSSKTKQTDRRKEKLLSKEGKINFFVANNLEDKNEILNFTLQNKIHFLKKKGFDSLNFKNLYKKLFNKINKNSKYICSALTIDKKIIASIVGRIDKENYYYLIPSTNESVAMRYSPGRILLKEQIKWCFENDIKLFDFGPGEFNYKDDWSNDHEKYFKILEPKNTLGSISCFLLRFKLNYYNSFRLIRKKFFY